MEKYMGYDLSKIEHCEEIMAGGWIMQAGLNEKQKITIEQTLLQKPEGDK